jgi:quercetin dioxygenase-like cupin family protein
MTMPHPPTIRPPAAGRRIAVVGEVYRFLAVGDETDGKYAMFEAFVSPGGGPPPHVHGREEESFYVLDGRVTFQVGDERFVAEAGTFLNVPVGSLHSFRNESDAPAKMIVSAAPAGLEKMFFEVGRPVPDDAVTAPPPTEADVAKLLAAAPRYGIEIRLPRE